MKATPAGTPRAESAVELPRLRRRWPWWVAGTTLAASVLAAVLWFVWLPEYRPELGEGERYGVDVSMHQGVIDWQRVAADDVDFTYVKATEGGDFTDARFHQNWAAAAGAGLDRGAYHFFTLCRDGAAQASHFLSLIGSDPGSLPPAVDLELKGNCSARPPGERVQRELATFLELVEEATDRQVVLYVGDEFERLYAVRDHLDRPLWHRRFLRRPNVEGWVLWQVMGFAHIDGISGDVDLNVMRGRDEVRPTAALRGEDGSDDLRPVDWANASMPASICGGQGSVDVKNGKALVSSSRWPDAWMGNEPPVMPAQVELTSHGPAHYGDIDGDGNDEAVVSVWCTNGGGMAGGQLANALVVFTGNPSSPSVIGIITTTHVGPYHAPYFGDAANARIELGQVAVTELFYGPTDGTCCPKGRAESVWRYLGGTLVRVSPALTATT